MGLVRHPAIRIEHESFRRDPGERGQSSGLRGCRYYIRHIKCKDSSEASAIEHGNDLQGRVSQFILAGRGWIRRRRHLGSQPQRAAEHARAVPEPAVAVGRALPDRVAGSRRAFVRRVVVRRHLVGVDVECYVADLPEALDRVGWELDSKLVLKFDKHGEQPPAAQTKIFERIAGEDGDIAQPPYAMNRRGDCLED
jgi:hypothetical protein